MLYGNGVTTVSLQVVKADSSEDDETEEVGGGIFVKYMPDSLKRYK
jgi:hypothetical protein